MDMERLKGTLLSDADAQAEKIVHQAKVEAQAMLEAERAKLSVLKVEAEKEVEQRMTSLKNERLAWARLESKRLLAAAREDAIKSALDEFYDVMIKMRKSADYKKFMENSVSSAVAELGSDAIVHVIKGEKELVPRMKGIKVAEDLESELGGAIIESTDGRVRINMSMETIIESKKDELRAKINEKMFGGSKA